MSTPYGFRLAPDLHAVLRSRPPPAALDWVRRVTGAVRVVGVTARAGGKSSAVHELIVEGGSGVRSRLVLRRYVLDWLVEEPDAPANEALVLDRLAGSAVPAPRLVAVDPTGQDCGVPAVLMTALAGRVDWAPRDRGRWLQRLAELLPAIHAVSSAGLPRSFAPYEPTPGLVPPPWTRYRWAWERALEQYARSVPRASDALIHRDFHPGNVLWVGGRVRGIVDWVGGCRGSPEADVAHCRFNLAVHFGQSAAEEFLSHWRLLAGCGDFDPYWDLTDAVSVVDAEADPRLDEFVRSAAERLAPGPAVQTDRIES